MMPHPDLHKEVSQVFLEGIEILVKAEEALNEQFDLWPADKQTT